MNIKKFLKSMLVLALLVSAVFVTALTVAAEENEYAAKIGDTEYATLAEAVKAVAKGTTATPTTIVLGKDQTISSLMIGHQYPQNIIIDLNGYTLSNNSIVLTSYRSGTTLTVQNGTVKGNSTSGTLRATYGGKLVLGDNLTVTAAGGSANLVKVDNGTLIVGAGTSFVGGKVQIVDSGHSNNNITIETIEKVAQIGDTAYETLAAAIEDAKDGDTIVLCKDISVDKDDVVTLDGKYATFFKVEGKTVTIDLNGKNVYGDAAGISGMLVGMFSTDNDGHLTLVDNAGGASVKVDANNANVYALIVNYEPGCTITINSGNYSLDKASDSLMYTGGNEGIIVKGGTFNLGNVGTGKNKSPWIFNAKGQNTAHVLVYGGSFNADIQHQYYPFEVLTDRTVAFPCEDGIYTAATAVAYVTEREFSGRWYTNEVGYATLAEAFAAAEGSKTSWDGQVSEAEEVVLLTNVEYK